MKKTNEVSKIVGISKRTLQFYDDEGMIRLRRSENNYRIYDHESMNDLWKIMIYKEMGLELKEIKELLLVSDEKKKVILQKKLKEIEEDICRLQGKMKFISTIITQGMPQIPEEDGITYVSKIRELREKYQM